MNQSRRIVLREIIARLKRSQLFVAFYYVRRVRSVRHVRTIRSRSQVFPVFRPSHTYVP